ncbi:hypothetical protein J7F02_25645 [Streptomyces sp. ISL-112]|uniref:hypothetical protein n=1 Tax=unclassified Streptomyces TaxID=2593676 RepID=UPI001BEB9428|nr:MULTISPECIES: hypothetical protein [unclassified Streptomyces]MBT2428917.1 hypothetical protein [Streptomyces sp. ISL-112]MBT2464185.1 hypothetical protein [Streptomyces sp. ISL-63]
MEPISTALLLAVAGGAGGEAGRQLWAKLSDLVRRETPETAGGVVELTSLEASPDAADRAQALGAALCLRAERDSAFKDGLTQWHQQAQALRTGDGDTKNTISGGTQEGPVLQGRDFSGINFNG